MKSLLAALQDGRLVELTASGKRAALELLSNLIEAIPSVPPGIDIFRMVMEREAQANTALGHAIACPHARIKQEGGDLLCAAGWSPGGIDYDAPDSVPVHLVCMYYVPSDKRGGFLREMSALAQAVKTESNMVAILKASSVDEVRRHLLGWVSQALHSSLPSTHARMIQIARRTELPPGGEPAVRLVKILILEEEGTQVFPLSDDPVLNQEIEAIPELAARLEKENTVQWNKYRLIVTDRKALSTTRVLYNCAVFLI